MSGEQAREIALRIAPSVTIASASYFVLCHTFQEADLSMPAVLAFPYAAICAILIYKLAGKQLSLYHRLRERPGVIGLFLFSLTGLPLLYFSWIAALGYALGEWRGILLGLAGGAMFVGVGRGIVRWKTRPRNRTRHEEGDGKALSSDCSGDRDILPLATYAFGVAMLIYASFLLLRYLYGYWDGSIFGAAELAASMLMVIPTLGWFSAFLAMLLNPDGKDQPKVLFWARSIVGMILLTGIVAYAVYQSFGDIYGRYGLLGIFSYLVSIWAAAVAVLRMCIEWKRKRRCVTLRRHLPSFIYALLWLLSETYIVGSDSNGKWLSKPEFILFYAAMVVECLVSSRALLERVRKNRLPAWEKGLNVYRVIGIALACMAFLCRWSGGADLFLSNGVVQTLLGVVSVEYYIAFQTALGEQNKEMGHGKPLRRKRLQPRSRLSSSRRRQV